MTKTEYREYLSSPHWQKLRKEFISGQTECNRCALPRWIVVLAYDQDLHAHHNSYARLGREQWEDLEALCRRCHELETFGRTSLAPVRTIPCVICKRPAYDVFPCGDPMCSACNTVENLHQVCQFVDPRNDWPLWKRILSTVTFAVGMDEILNELANIEIRQREARLRLELWEKEHPGEIPF
jgi:hypothetical protein